MPKKDILLKPGEEIPSDFRPLIEKYFGPTHATKLLRHGGLIRLSMAAPYTDRRDPKRGDDKINDDFMTRLNAAAAEPDSLRDMLAPLSSKQLQAVAKVLGLPTQTKESKEKLRGALFTHVRSGSVWKGIENR